MRRTPGRSELTAGAALTTLSMASRAGPAGVFMSCGAKPGALLTIGTRSPREAATPASEAVWAGPALIRIALTFALRSADTCADRSVSVALIFWATTFTPALRAAQVDPSRALAP